MLRSRVAHCLFCLSTKRIKIASRFRFVDFDTTSTLCLPFAHTHTHIHTPIVRQIYTRINMYFLMHINLVFSIHSISSKMQLVLNTKCDSSIVSKTSCFTFIRFGTCRRITVTKYARIRYCVNAFVVGTTFH
jgi:hypothetical protein